MAGNTREILLKLVGKETVSSAAKRAGDGLDRMGDSATRAAQAAKRLDKQMADVAATSAKLRQRIAETGDMSLFKDLGRSERDLKRLSGLRDMLGQVGDEGAQGFAARFSARIGPLMAQAPVSPPLVGAIAGAAPAIGAAVSAGVLLGLSGGTVAAGVKIAFGDPRVKAAGTALAADLGDRLTSAAESFVPATLGAIDIVRDAFGGIEADLAAAFDGAARYVAPLTRAITNLVDGAMPGIAAALDEASPVIYALEHGSRAVGEAIGDAMDRIGDGAAGAGLLVGDMLASVATGLQGIGTAVGMLSKVYGYLRIATATDKNAVIAEMAAGQASAAAYQAELNKLADGLRGTGSAATGAGAEIRSLEEILQGFIETTAGAFSAETRLGAAIDEASAAAYRNSAGISANTERGRANREMLDKLAQQTRDTAAALSGMAGGEDKATAAMERGYRAFIKAATGMGMSKGAADALARSLGLIPPGKHIRVTVEAARALAQARAIRDVVNGIRSKNITVGVWYQSNGDLKVPGGTLVKDRLGGMHVPMAAGGVMSSAGIYPPSNPPLVRFAEPGTGGEAYVPKRGRRSRSLGILSEAAGWYDAALVDTRTARGTRPARTGGGTSYQITVNVAAGGHPADVGRALVEAIRAYEKANGTRWRQ